MIITIDGEAASGKSSLAKYLAETLNIQHINTGTFYRASTYFHWRNPQPITKSINQSIVEIESFNWGDGGYFIINDIECPSSSIFSDFITQRLKPFVMSSYLRSTYIKLIKEYVIDKNCVIDGRGLAVDTFEDANYKFFVYAPIDIRTSRRALQFMLKGETVDYTEIFKDLKRRDQYDENRGLLPTIGTVLIDSSKLSTKEIGDEIIKQNNLKP